MLIGVSSGSLIMNHFDPELLRLAQGYKLEVFNIPLPMFQAEYVIQQRVYESF